MTEMQQFNATPYLFLAQEKRRCGWRLRRRDHVAAPKTFSASVELPQDGNMRSGDQAIFRAAGYCMGPCWHHDNDHGAPSLGFCCEGVI
ncbi:MAG TPA: hypothetical protein VNS79_07685 [Sphingobium sp.]|nr:hypothetical protein [Sphingobium sp.]